MVISSNEDEPFKASEKEVPSRQKKTPRLNIRSLRFGRTSAFAEDDDRDLNNINNKRKGKGEAIDRELEGEESLPPDPAAH